MRRTILSLAAVCGSTWGFITPGMADDFNPFAQQISVEEAVAPIAPEPAVVPHGEFPSSPPTIEYETHGGESHGGESHGGESHGGESHGGEAHGGGSHDAHGEEHHAEEHHEHHYHHAHEHEHEEKVGNIRVTPLFRQIDSDKFDKLFDSMYSVNVGTTFWQPEHHYCNFSTQIGLVTEFQYSALEARSNTNINSVVSIPFAVRENVRVTDADIYAGNIGLSFVANTYLPDSYTKLELGFTPVLSIGNLSTNLEPNTPNPNQTSIVLDRGASDNGTIIGGDFRLWTGIKTESGFRAGVTGFYGVAETDAIFDSNTMLNTYGGGFYVEMPTRFVPHEIPLPMGTLQWIEEIFGLE